MESSRCLLSRRRACTPSDFRNRLRSQAISPRDRRRGFARKSHGKSPGAPASVAIPACVHARSLGTSKCLQFSKGKKNHAQKQPAMAETGDLRHTERATGIANGNLDNLQIKFGGPKDQIKVTERVEIAEIIPIGHNLKIMPARQHFCAAKCVREALVQQPTENP